MSTSSVFDPVFSASNNQGCQPASKQPPSPVDEELHSFALKLFKDLGILSPFTSPASPTKKENICAKALETTENAQSLSDKVFSFLQPSILLRIRECNKEDLKALAEELGNTRSEKAVCYLKLLLETPYVEVRIAAAVGLGKIGNKDSEEQLLELAKATLVVRKSKKIFNKIIWDAYQIQDAFNHPEIFNTSPKSNLSPLSHSPPNAPYASPEETHSPPHVLHTLPNAFSSSPKLISVPQSNVSITQQTIHLPQKKQIPQIVKKSIQEQIRELKEALASAKMVSKAAKKTLRKMGVFRIENT